MSRSFEVKIDSIAAGGDGVGRSDGMVVFVPRTAPGDRAKVDAEVHGRLMRGLMTTLMVPSPVRVKPDCGHYEIDRCGGCQIQHLSYDAQLRAKSEIIRDSLSRIGGRKVDAPEVEASPGQWRYRRKLTLALRRRDNRWIAGLHRIDSTVFELRDCLITDEKVMQAWKAIMAHSELLPAANELRVAVRLLPGGFAVTVEGGSGWTTQQRFLDAVPEIVELWWHADGAARRVRFAANTIKQAGASFVQVNPAVADRLLRHVTAIASDASPKTAIDAYAGTGDIAVNLAGIGATVTAIEIDRDAASVCRSRLPQNATVLDRSVEHALAGALPAEFVVVNPPRAGLATKVAESLQSAAGPVRTLVYVSCDPGTLARDLKRMSNYRLVSVKGFDMFPQTAHVETVCALEAA